MSPKQRWQLSVSNMRSGDDNHGLSLFWGCPCLSVASRDAGERNPCPMNMDIPRLRWVHSMIDLKLRTPCRNKALRRDICVDQSWSRQPLRGVVVQTRKPNSTIPHVQTLDKGNRKSNSKAHWPASPTPLSPESAIVQEQVSDVECAIEHLFPPDRPVRVSCASHRQTPEHPVEALH